MTTASVQPTIKLKLFKVNEFSFKGSNSGKDAGSSKVNLTYNIGYNAKLKKIYSINFDIEISDGNKFKLNTKAQAIFESSEEITDEFKKSSFVRLNSPAIGFPFLRSFIHTVSVNAGLKPIILPSFNFTKFSASEPKSSLTE